MITNGTATLQNQDVPVVIVGGGPVGMLLAYQLDRLEVPCVLLEQNASTTQWPKMDYTNSRSMEVLRTLGLADEYRNQEGAVPAGTLFNTIFATDLTQDGYLLGGFVCTIYMLSSRMKVGMLIF